MNQFYTFVWRHVAKCFVVKNMRIYAVSLTAYKCMMPEMRVCTLSCMHSALLHWWRGCKQLLLFGGEVEKKLPFHLGEQKFDKLEGFFFFFEKIVQNIDML